MSAPFEIGERFERKLRLSAEDVRTFAVMVGDTNPLHHDQAYAKASRFGGLIASGVHSSALMGAFTADIVTQRGASLGLEVRFQFLKAVMVDKDHLMVWTVEGVEAKPRLGGKIIAFVGEMTDSAGAICLAGQVKCLALDEPA